MDMIVPRLTGAGAFWMRAILRLRLGLLLPGGGGLLVDAPMAESYPEKLIAEVIRLYPEYLKDPLDGERSGGNAAALALGQDGVVRGQIFGSDRERGQRVYLIASRKLMQVWRTGYPTGHFEELVYAGKLDEASFGIQRPDFIGWLGGVPLVTPAGEVVAAAFSGFRGFKDVELIERAGAAAGLKPKRV
jgi:hypothetical protein